MKYKGRIIAAYQTEVEAPGWRQATMKARNKFLDEEDLANPKNGIIRVGHIQVNREDWL